MASIYQLKPAFQALLRPLVQKLVTSKVTANQVTIAACLGSLIIAVIVSLLAGYLWVLWLIPLWMFIRMALNAIDGMLAREFNQKSALGAYLNELCDVISDSALFLAFTAIVGVSSALVVLVTILSLLTEYAGVMTPLIGGNRHYEGPMGKSDRAFVWGILSAGLAIGWLPISWVNPILWVMAALLAYTIINRVKQGLAEVIQNNKEG